MITGSWMVGMLRSLTSDYNPYTTEAGSSPVGHCKVLRFPRRSRCVAPRPSPEYECGKRNPLYPIRASSFVSIVLYLTCTIIVLLKKQMIWHLI
jgi:hypothetical protein